MPTSELLMLPEEILLKIFRKLPLRALTKTAQVSRDFQRISYDPTLWKRVVLQSQILCAGTLGFILSRGTTSLQVLNCQIEAPWYYEEPPNHGYELQSLRVKEYKESLSDVIRFIISHCRHLKKVTLEVRQLSILDSHCSAIAENAELEYLSLGCQGLTFAGLLNIIRSCPRLHTLEYGKGILMTPTEVETLVNELSSQVKVLDVFRYNESLHDEHVATLVKNCPNMTDLNFNGCQSITEVSMHHLALLQNLDNLNIAECTTLPYNAISLLPRVQRFKTLWYSISFN